VGKTVGKSLLGRPRSKWDATCKTDVRQTGCEGVRWMEPARIVFNGVAEPYGSATSVSLISKSVG